jgi:predicted metal-binding protein
MKLVQQSMPGTKYFKGEKMEHPIKKIRLERDINQITRDLERYQEKALESGASKAKIINVSDIIVDERVTLKCRIPRCLGYGACANCPPNTMKPAELRDILTKYNHAVFFIKEFPSNAMVMDNIKGLIAAYKEIYKIVSGIESLAFYDGYYLAFGLGAGTCRYILCGQVEGCAALKGETCKFAIKAWPSMEALGIDVFKMVAQSGWDIYPIGMSVKADDIPCGVFAGLIVIE